MLLLFSLIPFIVTEIDAQTFEQNQDYAYDLNVQVNELYSDLSVKHSEAWKYWRFDEVTSSEAQKLFDEAMKLHEKASSMLRIIDNENAYYSGLIASAPGESVKNYERILIELEEVRENIIRRNLLLEQANEAETTFYFGGSTIPTPTPPNASFPVEYVVIAVAIAVAAGIGIAFSRRKKVAPVMSASPAKSKATQRQDDTQFWVCPNCGSDTQMKDGRQYCSACKIYLSI